MPTDRRQFYIYPSVAVSDENVVYCPVGLHHKELWACDVRNGEKCQLLPPSLSEQQGSVEVWTGTDGRVYGRARAARSFAIRIALNSARQRPNGGGRHYARETKRWARSSKTGQLEVKDEATGQVHRVKTQYQGRRAFIFSVSV